MIAGIVVGCNGGTIRAPRLPVFAAQTIIGCLVARAVTGDIVFRFLKDWPLFLSVIIALTYAAYYSATRFASSKQARNATKETLEEGQDLDPASW